MRELKYDGFGWDGDILFCGIRLPLSIFAGSENAESPTPQQLKTVEEIEAAGDALSSDISEHARAYCGRVDFDINLEDEGIVINYEEIGKHYRAINVQVPELGEFNRCIFCVQYKCDWEPEHGMQILVEDGKVLSCGPCNGLFHSGRHWLKYLALSPAERKEQLRALAGEE